MDNLEDLLEGPTSTLVDWVLCLANCIPSGEPEELPTRAIPYKRIEMSGLTEVV